MAVRKIIENFIGTADSAEKKETGLGLPYSLNLMTEDTGEGKAVQRILKSVNGQNPVDISSFVVGTDITIGTIKYGFSALGYIWILCDAGICRIKASDDPTVASNWSRWIGASGRFTGNRYKGVVLNDEAFVLDYDGGQVMALSLRETDRAIQEIHLPTRLAYVDGAATYKEIVPCDIAASYGTVFLADRGSDGIFYSFYNFMDLIGTGNTPYYADIFDGYWDYASGKVVARDNKQGQWFSQTAVAGNMRALFVLDGTLYGLSTGCLQRYSYNSSTTEPYVPDMNGVFHIRAGVNQNFQSTVVQDSNAMTYAEDDAGFGGLYLIGKDGVAKVSTREMDVVFAQFSEPEWLSNMRWYPNHRMFGVLMYDMTADTRAWAVYDMSTKDWHWRTWFPWIQVDKEWGLYSKGNDRLQETTQVQVFTDSPAGLDMIRQGGAIDNNGDSFICDRCELQMNNSGNGLATVQYAWEDNEWSAAEPVQLSGSFSPIGLCMGMGRTLTIKLTMPGLVHGLTSPLEIRRLKIAYRACSNFLGRI